MVQTPTTVKKCVPNHVGQKATAAESAAATGLLTAYVSNFQVRSADSRAMQQQWESHCRSISSKLAHAAESVAGQDQTRLRDLAEQVCCMNSTPSSLSRVPFLLVCPLVQRPCSQAGLKAGGVWGTRGGGGRGPEGQSGDYCR